MQLQFDTTPSTATGQIAEEPIPVQDTLTATILVNFITVCLKMLCYRAVKNEENQRSVHVLSLLGVLLKIAHQVMITVWNPVTIG